MITVNLRSHTGGSQPIVVHRSILLGYFLKSMNSLPTFKNRRFYINIQISGFSLTKKRKKENRSDGPSLYSVMAKTRGS